MAGTAILMVRAVVANPADRAPFDHWYETEHLPDAKRAFGALRAWRGWNPEDPSVHFAWYEFRDLAHLESIDGSDGQKAMYAEFDRHWGERVPRARHRMVISQTL